VSRNPSKPNLDVQPAYFFGSSYDCQSPYLVRAGSVMLNRSGLPQGSPLSPVLFGLTCGRILKELPEGCSYVDGCAWTISFDNLGDKNELASKVRRLLDQARTVFRKHGMELDEQKTELALIYKANQKRKQWEIDANRWSMRWQDKTIQFNKGNTRWLGFHLDRCQTPLTFFLVKLLCWSYDLTLF
jgi:hypothetical protein